MKHSLRLATIKEKLEINYKLNHFALQIKNRTYKLATISNVDQVMDDIIVQGPQSQEDNSNPYWAELWHSAIGIAEMIEEGKVVKPRQKVLEIGCGIGLCGIAAAFKGAEVILTDIVPEALMLAEYNWLLNHQTLPTCRILDWRRPEPTWKTDLLIASDVAYEDTSYQPLVDFFKEMVNPGGEIWLSEPGRSYTQSWVSKITDHGFFMDKFTYFVTLQGLECQVGIYRLESMT